MSSLSSYLAKNYLTASNTTSSDLSDRPKKRRKKDKSSTEPQSLVVDDDDDLLLSSHSTANGRGNEDEDTPLMYEGQAKSAEFRKKKQSAWKSVATGDAPTTSSTNENRSANDSTEQDEADRILQAAADAEDDRRREVDMDDAPAVVVEDDADNDQPRMQSGARAGLQTAADTAALMEKEERERRAEEKRLRREHKNRSGAAEEEETIYRDATGRRIDVSLKRAEARKAQQEEEKRKKKEREEAMGEVQRQQKEERKQELEDAQFLTLGRGAEDEEMNEKLKAEVRWDDPMAGYVLQKQAEEEASAVGKNGTGSSKAAAAKKAGSNAKVYQGAAPPNRYGIKPGRRWDGVDRGNGFEKEWFQARSRKTRNEELSYQWAMDE